MQKKFVPYFEQGVRNLRNNAGSQSPLGERPISRVVVDMLDHDTGEYLGCFVDTLGAKPAKRDWVRMFKGLAKLIAQNPRWPTDTRVFMLLIWQLEYGNFLAVSRADIAKYLAVARNTVGRVINQMLTDGIIQADSYKGRDGFRLNPNYVHMGSDSQRQARRAEWARMLEARAKAGVAAATRKHA